MIISQALKKIKPLAQFIIKNESYDGLVMLDGTEKPSLSELQEAWKSIENEKINQENFQNSLSEGFFVEPEGFILGLQEHDRSSFSQMLSLVKEALDLGLISNDTPQTIKDINGQPQQLSTLRFRQIMAAYGFYYKQLWDQLI